MPRESQRESFFLLACSFVTKYSIYALVFLMPVFFLPWTTDVLDFNKQAALLLLVFLSLFALMIKILVSGKFEINKSPMHVAAGVLFVIYLFATIFSIYRYGSFWGQSQQISESMLTVASFLLLYFLVSNVFSKKEILTSLIVLSFSAVIAELIGILQLFGLFIIPFDFAKSVAFNTVGSPGSLGFFAAILLPLSTLLLIVVKKWWKVLFIVQLIFSVLILILINYAIIWWVAIAGSALVPVLVLVMSTMKKNLFDGRWLALPVFFLAISLFFVFFNLQINLVPQKPNEIFLLQGAGLNIGMQAVRERPVFGSGPGTFAYNFSKFKSTDFSSSSLWNVTFGKSSSKILNSLATTGAMGFLATMVFMAFPIFYGIKFIIAKKESASGGSSGRDHDALILGLFVAVIAQSIAYFLYNSNVALDFVYFFAIAALIGLISENRKNYILKPSSTLTLITTFIFTLVFIFGIGVVILNGQRYFAETDYSKGILNYQTDQKDEAANKLRSAVNLNPKSDLYFRQLSLVFLLNLQDEISTNGANPTDEQKTKIQTLVNDTINAAKTATDINPKEVANWSSRGYIYQNLLGLSGDASTWAINSYDSALELDPNNPYLFVQEGNVYLASALNLPSDQAGQKEEMLNQAKDKLEKAISLNSNYSNALYSLGIVYDSLGQKDKAIEEFTKVQQLNPADTSIPKILDNLKSGKSIIQNATPPAENPPSGTSGTPENQPAR